MRLQAPLLAILLLPFVGCMSGGILRGKDVNMQGVDITIGTPWGIQTIKAKSLVTKVNPKGTRVIREPDFLIAPAPETNATTVIIIQDGKVSVLP